MLPKLLCSDMFGHLLYSDYAKKRHADKHQCRQRKTKSGVSDEQRQNLLCFRPPPRKSIAGGPHIPTEQLLCLEIDTIKCKQTEQQTVDASISINNQRANMRKLTVSTTVTACLNIQKSTAGVMQGYLRVIRQTIFSLNVLYVFQGEFLCRVGNFTFSYRKIRDVYI